jgi:hypothetical protein
MAEPLYRPLYPPEGGQPVGFQCGRCPDSTRAVTRTKKGIRRHLQICHQVVFQESLFPDQVPRTPPEPITQTPTRRKSA